MRVSNNGMPRTASAATVQVQHVNRPSTSHSDTRSREQLLSDLHDRLGPGLAGLEVRLQVLAEAANKSATAPEQVASLRDEVSRLVGELRRIVHNEPPETLEQQGLVKAVKGALSLVARAGLSVNLAASGNASNLPAAVADLLYRAALEGTANVVRHAHARRCWVTIHLSETRATLVVRDDGIGHLAWGKRPTGHGGSIGLASLRNAAHRTGGRAHLLRKKVGGTALIVTVPLVSAVRIGRPGSRSRPVTT